jgi:hypothetical protein
VAAIGTQALEVWFRGEAQPPARLAAAAAVATLYYYRNPKRLAPEPEVHKAAPLHQ